MDETPVTEGDGAENEPEPLVAVTDLAVGTTLMVPKPGVSAFQDALAASNGTARRRAIAKLTTWFADYDFDAAAHNVDDRRFTVIAIEPALLKHLNGPEVVDRVLSEHHHAWAVGVGMSFSHGEVAGHTGPPPRAAQRFPEGPIGRISPGGLAAVLDDRWTAIVNGIGRYDPALGEVIEALTLAYGSRVNTNAYISYGPAAEGFGAHWDTHDTIIVPIHGAKRWTVFEPPVLSPERPWIGRETTDRVVWDGVIEPGVALVIPRGWGHRVEGSADISMHYTIGVTRLEAHNLLERVAFEAGYLPSMRADVPYSVDAQPLSYGGSIFDEPHGLARTIAEIATPELVDRAIASHRARLAVPRFGSLRDSFRALVQQDWTDLGIRLHTCAGVTVAEETDERAVVAFENRAVQLRADALAAFAALAAGGVWRPADLPAVGEGGPERQHAFAREIVSLGLASVVRAR